MPHSNSLLPVARFAALALFLVACGDGGTPPRDNPTPGITSLSPAQVDQGSPEVTLTVTGTDFVRSSVVRFNGGDRTTTYVSATEVRATLPATDFGTAGTAQVVVANPAPGGGTSNIASLTIGPVQAAVPTIVSMSPTFTDVGSATTTVTITGTGFSAQSRVVVGFAERTTTWISPTQLRFSFAEAELVTSGTHSVRVMNPDGMSNAVTFQVRQPVPVLTSLSQTQINAGQEGFTLSVNGTGFTSASVVRFNGAPRATTRTAAGTLQVVLLEGDLSTAGTYSITVVNPQPGGGTSNALTLTLVNGDPEITLLPSRGASAGRSGFTLYVHGRGFVSGAVVRWNGSPRATQYISGTRLAATISSADVAAPGVAQVTVVNPAPAGGTSAAATMTIRQLGSSASTSRELALRARDIAWNAAAGRFYASVVGSVSPYGNSVVAIDPTTMTITADAFVGSEPGKLAISDNNQYLYVGLNGANAVRRVGLPTLTPGLQWSVGAGLVAGDIAVLPGFPLSVAVARQSPGTSPPLAGVTVYDDGVARPTSSPGHTGGNRIEFLASPSMLYGYNNSHTGFEFFRIAIDASGARHVSENGGLISGFYTDIVGAAGRIYGTDGSVVDAEQRVKIGSFGTNASAIAVDPDLGRAYLLIGAEIRVHDLNTFQHLGSVAIPAPSFDHPALVSTRLLRWGTDGLAFLDQTRFITVRSPLIGP